MPLKGTLGVFSTIQILHLINLAKKTGVLRIYEGIETGKKLTLGDGVTTIAEMAPGKQRAEVAFKEGKLLFASMQDKSGDLTSVLQKAGKLNDEQARIIRERAKNHSDKALALMLINANYVTKQNVIQSIQKHTVDIVFDLTVWDKEPFEFEENAEAPQDRITVPINLENVIIEATRRRHDEEQLKVEIPDLDMGLKFRDAPGDKFKDIQLSTGEWRVVGFVNPKNSIRQIAKACNMTDTEIRQVVHALLEAGLVELVKPPSPRKETKAPSGLRRPDRSDMQDKALVNKLINRIKQI